MVSFEGFRAVDGVPIYLQIQTYIRRGCVAGTIRDGDELPSRRVLSALLGVNPNTVQKAYRLLEEEGVLVSRAGARSCVQVDGAQVARIREALLREEVGDLVSALRQMGVTREEAHILGEVSTEQYTRERLIRSELEDSQRRKLEDAFDSSHGFKDD